MICSVNKTMHADFSIFSKHKLAPRAYAVPYSKKTELEKTDIKSERYSSDMVRVLSGEWDFKFYKSIADLPDKLNTLKVKFDKITVPSDWQRTGYQEPVYLNCPYEFKTMAPEIPEDMPVGVYRKFFDVNDTAKQYIISFLGVANNLALYVNGKFAGYSEGTHNTAEFDITPLLIPGANELLIVSFKWCNGSFLEAQDMFRENGIFRDVLLYEYGNAYIYDFELKYTKCENGYDTAVETVVKGSADGCTLTAELKDAKGKTVAKAEADGNGKASFGVIDVIEWNAEIPTVYYLYLTLKGKDTEMTLRSVSGFKTITIENGVFYWNGAPVKLKGVNHHDTDMYKGYAMSLDDMERDVLLMKSLNVNAVRTSHYPPDPFFLTLADVNGLYIVDEADIETHGCWEMAEDVSILSQDLKWATHYVDRVKRMYFRDRNHPCVIMWSLGNESGGYRCHDKCYKFLKSTGTQIPVHYEGVVGTKRFHYDVISEMYTNTYAIEEMMKGIRKRSIDDGPEKICKEYNKYPFYLCEYCHAMGVGPGNMEEYWDLFYEWKNSMGGCIWEWADHVVYHPDNDKKYKYRYTYGGDHGEKQHDGHFCVDALVYADRSLHTGAKEMKVVYRPLRASQAGEKLYCIENTNRFRDSSYVGIKWVLLQNGKEVDCGEITTSLAPMQAECIKIDHKDIDYSADAHINFIYTDKTDGREIAVEQLTLNDVEYEYDIEIGSKIAAEVENGIVTVKFENGECVFNGATGDLTSYIVDGKQLLAEKPAEAQGFIPNLYRALIDNDSRMRGAWKDGGLDSLKKSLKSFDAHINDGEIEIVSVFALKAKRKELYEVKMTYTISSLGAMEVKAELKVTDENAVTDIPRFGLTVELDRDFENVAYYGRGTAENMPDFKAQSPVGIYEDTVDNMFEPYVYPQESGMHCDVKWIELKGKDAGIKIYADDSLAFSVHHFTQNAINKAQHQEDLKDMGITFLTLDGFVRGIGSSSCGPDTRDEYKGNANDGYEVSFTVIPQTK